MTASSYTETQQNLWWMVLLQGITSLVIGFLLLFATEAALSLIMLLLGLWWLIQGLFSIVSIFIDKSRWGWKLVGGILGVIVGILVLQHPAVGSVLLPRVTSFVVGVGGIIMGVIILLAAFQGGGWGTGIVGLLSLILGLLLLLNPLVGGLTLVLLMAILSILGGIVCVILAFRMR